MTKWAATYWPDPREGEFFNYEPDTKKRAAAEVETRKRAELLREEMGKEAFAASGLQCCENGIGSSWAAHRILSLTTHLPRAIQTPVWRGWVLSRAVMGRPRHYDDLAWSLRENPVDGPAAARALLGMIEEPLGLRSPDVREMVLALLEAHGGPASIHGRGCSC